VSRSIKKKTKPFVKYMYTRLCLEPSMYIDTRVTFVLLSVCSLQCWDPDPQGSTEIYAPGLDSDQALEFTSGSGSSYLRNLSW
jgi:hypothetical protein